MDDLAIIDRFTETFSRYIDSGFGLLAGDVAFLTTVLVAIDITLAGIFWAMYGDENVPVQLIRKVLYVGFFALLLNNFKGLADIVFQSFAGPGLKASGTAMTAATTNRAGQRLIERQLNVQPTITVRPGWPLRVIVHTDIVLRPYRGATPN
jgi:type IV secretion system protein TrbL